MKLCFRNSKYNTIRRTDSPPPDFLTLPLPLAEKKISVSGGDSAIPCYLFSMVTQFHSSLDRDQGRES